MSTYIAYVAGLLLGTLIFLQPIQSWLAGRIWTGSLFGLSLLTSTLCWGFYGYLTSLGWREARPMFFISAIVLAGIGFQWSWARFFPKALAQIPEERRFGWVLFTGLMVLAVVIFVPLGAALFQAALR